MISISYIRSDPLLLTYYHLITNVDLVELTQP